VLTLGGVGTLGLGYSLGHVLGASSPVFDRLVATSFPLAVSLGLLAASVGLYRGRFDVEYGTVLGWELVGVVVALGSLAWARAGTFPGATGDRFLPLVVVGAGALGGVLLALSRHRGERVEDLERYGAVVESTRDGLFAAADGTVTMVNPRMSELVGVDRERLVGADLDRLADRLLDEGDAGQSGAVVGDLAGRDPVEVTLTPVDRGPITCELEVSRLDQEGDHLVGMARDVSRYVRLRQQLSVTNRVLRHNLRTSTNLIAGHARIVEVDATDEATAERARSVRTEAQRLSTLADKARLLSEIVEEGHESRLVETDPADPIAEAVERVRADHGEAEYDVDVPPGLRVRAHPQIARAIAEAIENAVVHSGDATPWVSVAVVPGERFHEVRIADDGPGIPEYERGVLRRATESDLDHGSGIGLWLLRWVVDLSEGELAFEERPPTGSVVVVRLPAVDAPDGRDSPPADDPSG
jgi:PAS domain S-box-containing protein